MATISTMLNLYLTCCFLMSPDLRELKNYPIFLLSLTDFIVTGPGYSWKYISKQFIVYHPSNFSPFFSHGPEFLNNLRTNLQSILQRPITENIDPFWFSCLPNLAMIRMNEYAYGICSLLLAYERYVCVCKATEKSTLHSSQRRKKIYVFATMIIVCTTIADAIHSYIKQKWNCTYAFNVQGVPMPMLRLIFC